MRGLLALLFVLLAAGPAQGARRFALVVGSNAGDRSEVQLRYAESDAERLARILRDVGDFEAQDVLLVTQADAESVRRALIGINARVRSEPGGALLFVYYSGHGDAESLHLGGTRLDMRELRDLVAGSPATARVLVIDSCRSGAITRIKGGSPGPAFRIAFDRPSAEGVAILTSSAAGEDSQESDSLGASIFTHYLASALLGAADHDGDGRVTLGEAFAYASERTLSASVSTAAGPQHPTYRFDLGGRDDLVLTQPVQAGRRMGILAFSEGGSWLVSEGGSRQSVVAEVTTDAKGARLALRPGSYSVIKRGRDFLLQGEISVTESATTQVEPGSLRRIDYAQVVRKGGTERASTWSAFVQSGVRGSLLELGGAFQMGVGIRFDLPLLAIEGRVGRSTSSTTGERLRIDTRELSLSLGALHAFDLGFFSLGAGVEAGGSWFDQAFHERQTPDRRSYGLQVGPLATIEAPLAGPLHLRIDGALLTYFLPGQGRTETPVTFRAGAGLGMFF
ncbi:caspase family protein [Vulgatibacter incomptus]|uniref:Peptidase C14 caspase catalytic subunit p20 n=1 Tax=Vulgatibacter incomptus TaxID=1391653 RepID=A0A0K1PCA1_9BACT|nr:caspase family protein [Vulgatibacter incomptus]AKU91150.1 peptidase C14 caspase catalytic subunit p20 [Vulgatibacter incomptus]